MPLEASISSVEQLAHTCVSDCYQCGKCSAGCPMAEHMDLLPNQLVRLVQLGHIDKAMRSTAVWQCVSCMTCTTRCPKSVDCNGILDALSQLSVEWNAVSPAYRRTVIFQQAFLNNIRRHGRVAELNLVGKFKMHSFRHDLNIPHLFKDALLAPKLFRRGKLCFMPGKVRDRGVVERIFQRCQQPQAQAENSPNHS